MIATQSTTRHTHFMPASELYAQRRGRVLAMSSPSARRYFQPANENSTNYNDAQMLDPHSVRQSIESLLHNACYDEALLLAMRTGDDQLYGDTAVNVHRLKVSRRKTKESEMHGSVLPCRESIMRAAHDGSDVFCSDLLQRLCGRSSREKPLSDAFVQEIVCCAVEHWMLQTCYTLEGLGYLSVSCPSVFEELLASGFGPIVMNLAEKETMVNALCQLPEPDHDRIASKYAHCVLSFVLRQSRELARLKELLSEPHTEMLTLADVITLCRYEERILMHMTDKEITERIYRIEGVSAQPLDSFAVCECLCDLVEYPWSEDFDEMFDSVFSSFAREFPVEAARIFQLLQLPSKRLASETGGELVAA